MIKEIKYNGFSASPGDHEALEGDLAVAMNLIPEHNTIRPVLPPSVIAPIPKDPVNHNDNGRRILCIHKTSAYEHYIVAIDFDGLSPNHPPYTNLYHWDGTEGSDPVRFGAKAFNEVYKVEPVGNTLVVLADDGIHYFLWKQDAYQYLGNHLPELDLSFSLTDGQEYTSDEHKVEWDVTGYEDVSPNAMTPISWFDTDEKGSSGADNGKEVGAKLRQAIMASLNGVVADACADKRFAFPLFVRYGYRLYDSTSITMHSAPILLVPTLNSPTLHMGWAEISNDGTSVKSPAKVTAGLTAYHIRCRPLDLTQVEELSNWSDIISSVDVFISPQFYTYNQGAKDREIIIGPNTQPPRNSLLKKQICNNGSFYLIKEVRLSADMPQRNKLLQQGGGEIELDFETTNDNIVTRELMTDDYGTHDELFADKAFAYNNRINLAGVSKRLFNGFNPECMWHRVGDTSHNSTTAVVVVDTAGKQITVESPAGDVYYTPRTSTGVLWFFYPDASAKWAYMTINGQILELELIPHPMLNGAYFCSLDEDAVQQSVDSIPTPSTPEDRLVDMPNKIYTSEVNNPFYFPKQGINSISSGEIKGICAAVRPMSSGQYGYADLYIFADNGIWTAKINDKGSYGNLELATGDVCINPDSITQMETSVLFTTDRGIMLISGSQAQCISEAIDDKNQLVPIVDIDGNNIPARIAGVLGMKLEPVGSFEYFLAECRMIYDYTVQRIIVYNPGYNYAYIYSLESNKWGMMQCNIDYSVRAYPKALAVNRDGELVDCSVGDGTADVSQMLLTRPLTFDLPDVHKTVRAVLQRGLFARSVRNSNDHVKSVLLGSRDLINWHVVRSSQDENMRGFSGTPYKWFRVALLLRLKPNESVTGCSIQFETKYTNRLR